MAERIAGLRRRQVLLAGAGMLWAGSAAAALHDYRLDLARSRFEFLYRLSGVERVGRMPALSATLRLDLWQLARSSVEVVMDAAHADAGLPFATSAMLGPDVLDAARFPTIRFASRGISGTLNAARVAGDLTMRGVTRPATFSAQVYRQAGEAPDPEHRRLTVLLNGTVSRGAFGAAGFSDLVDDAVAFRILARIERGDA